MGLGDPVVRDRDGRGREGVSWKRKSSSQFSVGVAVETEWVRAWAVSDHIRNQHDQWASDEGCDG